MPKIIISIFLVLTFLCSPAMSKTITVRQAFGGGQSPDDARISAIAKAKREALEMAGTYIESLTVVQNFKVEKDEILALTACVLKAEVLSHQFGIDHYTLQFETKPYEATGLLCCPANGWNGKTSM